MKKSFLNKRLNNNVGVGVEVTEIAVIAAILLITSLVLPIALYGKSLPIDNQFIIGPLVNCALIFSALNIRGTVKSIGIVCLPSVLAVSIGLIGFMGIYAMYMIPAIWLGNASLVFGFKYLHVHKKVNYWIVATASILLKAALIFGGFQLLVSFGAIPTGPASKMLLGMGVYQLITATVGCLLAFGVVKTLYRRKQGNI